MAHQILIPRSDYRATLNFGQLADRLEEPWYRTIADNVRDALFPQKQAPLRLTSRPVRVRGIWGAYDYKRSASLGSILVHVGMLSALLYLSIAVPHVEQAKKHEVLTWVPTVSPKEIYTPTVKPLPNPGGGGGGGGDRDKLQAPKGRLPKQTMEQITPPAMVIRNDHPKLA